MNDVKHLTRAKPTRTVVIHLCGDWIFNVGAGLFFIAMAAVVITGG